MTDYILREYEPGDIPVLSELWIECFGDTPGFVKSFFDALPHMGGGIVALRGGEILGAAYTINGLELVCGSTARRIGYIYGVGVGERFRGCGIGAALDREVYALSKKLGAGIVSTLPAEESLYGWYESVIGMRVRLYRRLHSVISAAGFHVSPAGAAEYAAAREKLLSAVPHIRLSPAAMEFQGALLGEYGGGFFTFDGGIAAACMDGRRAQIRELICSDTCADAAAAAVGAALGAEAADVFFPAENGELYIAADGELPAGCVWNLSFD